MLSVSPVLMERYLLAAERVARTAVFGPEPRKPTLERKNAGPRKIVESTDGAGDATTRPGLSLPNAAHVTHRFPVDGEYLIRVYGGGIRPAASEPVTFTLWIDGREIASQILDPEASASFADDQQELGGKALDFRTTRQRRRALGGRLDSAALRGPAGLLQRPQSLQPPAVCLARVPGRRARTPRRSASPKRCKRYEENRARVRPVGDARVGYMEIGGPYTQTSGSVGRQPREDLRLRSSPRQPRRRLRQRASSASLAERAFRRPVPATGSGPLHRRSSARRGSAASRSTRASRSRCRRCWCRPISCSASSRIASAAGHAGREHVSQHELATRLSYFLWASMPDQALRARADAGTLRKPDVLAAEVRRMLQDPRAAALVREFGGQWLQFRALENVKPDVEKFPDFDQYLRMSMREETERFFERIVREDRSILDFLDAKYTFLNERLARHYGVAGVDRARRSGWCS